MTHILNSCGHYRNDWTDGKYTLKQTCGACPEQYDMLDEDGETVGYFRLRHGRFTVEYPDVGGKLVLRANTIGDGLFDGSERMYWLTAGYREIIKEIQNEKVY